MAGFALLGVITLVYALAASRLERISVGGPLVFAVAGLALGPAGLSKLDVPASGETMKVVTELTLALLLFADASTVGLGELRRRASLPFRLLAIGLPLCIAAGTLLAHWLFAGSTWWVAALIATILAPTDAALSIAVVTNPQVPRLIRTTLNVESGLNDGIASPLVVLLIALVAAEETAAQGWLTGAVKAIAIALAVAVVLGAGGGWLAARAHKAGWTTPLSDQLAVLALALLSFTGSVWLGGNGFVASFVAGLVFGGVSRQHMAAATEYTETTGLFMSYVVWALFGAALVGPLLLSGWHAHALIYAVLSLTVIRMVPVGLALLGTKVDRASMLFIGWFGPRGLASIVFLIIAGHGLELAKTDLESVGVETVVWTIALSVVLHGLTSGPLSARFGRRQPDEPVLQPDGDLRRRRLGLANPSGGPLTPNDG
jgi:sodium/hydrogen antiporter